ncbi:phage holin family protein [Streptomyces alkaliphilus]|uniref:phage holin family protein n=1 Tax=Streptomyces alkaliphilus TaxID=1472722 RepID=UPI00117DE72C|nr:phage holin family protein [Streptomyces alkaliphilus]MQS08559.1 phage holin family protein [Streptomyces alkaliphilus]
MSAADEGRSIGRLVSDATGELSGLMRDEMELAKARLKHDVQQAGAGGGALAAGGVVAIFSLPPFAMALGYWLHAWWNVPIAIAFLITAGVFLLVAGILALVGRALLRRNSPKQDLTASIKESAAVLSHAKPHPRGDAPALPPASANGGGSHRAVVER